MPEEKRLQIRGAIRKSNQVDERRMREAPAKVSVGDIDHHRRMEVEELFGGAHRNLARLRQLADPQEDASGLLVPMSENTAAEAAADVRNYVRFIEERIAKGAQAGAEE